jgi:Spy/CpxP family protein refolding chaperone
MKRFVPAALVAALLSAVTPLAAQPGPPHGGGGAEMIGGGPPGPPAFLSQVFPPRLVMEHQQEIGLRPAQADAIKQAMTETQQKLLDLQWRLDAESEALAKLLQADHVEETAVLAKLDEVTSIEQQVKKTNFALLVRIKNQLDKGQQEKLRALRPSHRFGGPPGPPPGP